MKWPRQLILIRHGESVFNASRRDKDVDPEYQFFKKLYEKEARRRSGFSARTKTLVRKLMKRYRLNFSDNNTPLTSAGIDQSAKTGAALPAIIPLPDQIFVSPYLRTLQTLDGLIQGWPKLSTVKRLLDERIRERNIGLREIYNDWRFLNVFHPDQARLHDLQGKFYYCVPQGESIVDVQLRTRQWLQTVTRESFNRTILVVTHHVTILGVRSLLERWTPEKFISMDETDPPKNCSVTIYKGDPKKGGDGKLILKKYNEILY